MTERELVAKAIYDRHIACIQYYDEVSGPPWHGLSEKLRDHWLGMADDAIATRVQLELKPHEIEAARIYEAITDLLTLPEIYSAEAVTLARETLQRRLMDGPDAIGGAQRELAEDIAWFLNEFPHDGRRTGREDT